MRPFDRFHASEWASGQFAWMFGAVALAAVAASAPAAAQNIRGDASGPTSAPGFSHPEQYIHLKDVKISTSRTSSPPPISIR